MRDRIDLNRKIQLRFERFQDFLTEIAGNISTGGMFVRSEAPHEPGEQFEFECSLADGYPLVSGRAEVVWTREQDTAADRPAGMGVRFLQLKDKSESLIRKIVEQRIKAGQQPFVLEREGSEERRRQAHKPASDSTLPSAGDPRGGGEPSRRASSAPSSPSLPDPKVDQPSRTSEVETPTPPSRVPTPPTKAPTPPTKAPTPPTKAPTPPSKASTPPTKAPTTPSKAPTTPSKAPTRPPSPPRVRTPPSASSAPPAKAVRQVAAEAVQTLPKPPAPSAPSAGRVAAPTTERTARALPTGAGAVADSAPRPTRSQAAAGARKRLGLVRFLELVLISTLAGAFMVLAFNQYWVRPRVERLEARLEELTGASGDESPAVLSEARNPSAAPQEAGEEGVSTEEGVSAENAEPPEEVVETAGSASPEAPLATEPRPTPRDAVQDWARAWSDQSVEDYLGYYSADFVPASGLSRTAWERRRRERLSTQGAIRVAVVSFRVEELGPDEVRATFTQSYRSNVYQDRVRKSLRMLWIDDRWQIAEEVVIRQLPW